MYGIGHTDNFSINPQPPDYVPEITDNNGVESL